MNLVEWTVRLGICSLEEAVSSEWRARERGIPRRHIEFNPQQAWEELTHPAAGQFESTLSRFIHLNDPILRLVQLYLGCNLLGQSNSFVRTSMTELYFLWSARRGRRIHIGFWTAYQCHLIATHPARNLSLCHIVGAFVRKNIAVVESERLSPMYMVDPLGCSTFHSSLAQTPCITEKACPGFTPWTKPRFQWQEWQQHRKGRPQIKGKSIWRRRWQN